ncbi:MAG: hypothetical protein JXA11_10845 [Phycisphaerae bacterium]|nr:hypothetical protein [Phycisphaerae bacterium]
MRQYGNLIVSVWGVVWLCSVAAADDAPRDAPAAEGLLHSAMNLYHAPSAAARAGRLVAISEYLASLDPGEPRYQRLLADVYQSQGQLEKAARAAKAVLDADPNDFAAGERWLRFQLDTYNRAGERIAFLQSVLKDAKLPEPLRSVAALELARIYVGQGAKQDADEALKQSLQLDPLNQTALLSRLEWRENPTPVDRAETMLSLWSGNPRAYWVTRQLAGLLCELGLHEEALRFYRHTWSIRRGTRPVSEAPVDFAVEYVSALLDADKPDAAVTLFAPAIERLETSTEFCSLMIEAYTKAGQSAQADPLRKTVEDQYRRQLLTQRVSRGMESTGSKSESPDTRAAKMTADVAVNFAWYYLLVEKNPAKAGQSITDAVELGAKGQAVDLCTGAAQLAAGDAKGLQLLEPLVDQYPLAAAYVARYQLGQGLRKEGTKTLLAGMTKGRRNLAYRMLHALAAKYQIDVPPAEYAQTVAEVVKKADPHILEMALEPDKFIRITVTAPSGDISLCEPIHIRATLENIGPAAVSVGVWGLLDHQLGLESQLAEGGELSFASMPMLTFPSPRYLAPKHSVAAEGRLDVGPIARFLANHPLLPVELRVDPIVSPRETTPTPKDAPRVVSGLEPMKVSPLTVRRRGLLASETAAAEDYNQALASLRKSLAEGDVSSRVLTARRVAAILAWIRDVENGSASVPQGIRPVMNETYVLGLMGMALRDQSDLVRAEMVTALQYADMGAAMLNEVGLVVNDPSPLVRFRVAELIGASGTKGNQKLIELYAKDADPRVRTMARAFLHEWKKTKTTNQKSN